MLPILYGSQTGTGMHLSSILKNRIPRSFAIPIDSFDILQINSFPLIIFICSTHGDGQCPFNMSKFYHTILPQTHKLFRFKFAILGLGDSSYPKYNHCAKIVSTKIKQLGGELVYKDYCNSQDENGVYDGFNRFLSHMIDYTRAVDQILIDSYKELSMKYLDAPVNSHNTIASYQMDDRIDEFASRFMINNKKYSARIVSNRLVTPENYEKRVYEIIFDILEYNDFYPGDCIAITPRNSQDLGKIFNFTMEEIGELQARVDFYSIVQQTTFAILAKFPKNEEFRSKLLEISKDYDLYHSYIVVPKRTLLEVIEDFELDVPFDCLVQLNPIYPRYFSFSRINGKYHVLYNEINFKTYMRQPRTGLCSEYLKTLEGTIEVGIIQSKLFFEDKKLLFFSTGTGVTLPRSAIHFFNDKEIKIFYGFRYYNVDHLCKDEFPDAHLAASRDDNKYIMDVYREHPVDNIKDWLVFVSGNSRLNKEIKELLTKIHGENIVLQSETW